MRKKGMSISDLAIRSGVDRNTISSWRRRGTMTLNSMECCLGVFGLELMAVNDPKKIEIASAKMAAYKVTMDLIKHHAETILKVAK
jgi:transcriptional regulator with XRE-family HTH domain